jgi:HK97 family phage major capsid protein
MAENTAESIAQELQDEVSKIRSMREEMEKDNETRKANDTKLKLEQAREEKPNPNPKNEIRKSEEDRGYSIREIKDALLEKRSITVNGAGGVNFVQDVIVDYAASGRAGPYVTKFYSPSASTTKIPTFTPVIAAPVGSTEGTTGSDGTSNNFGAVTLDLVPYLAIPKISRLALKQPSFENALKQAIAEAYGVCVDKQVITGLFSATTLGTYTTAVATSAPTSADLIGFALELIQKLRNPANARIYLNAKYLANIIAEGNDALNIGLLSLTPNVYGVPLVVTNLESYAVTAGTVAMCGGDLRYYGWGLANEVEIVPVESETSDMVTMKSIMYQDFGVLLNSQFEQMVIKA